MKTYICEIFSDLSPCHLKQFPLIYDVNGTTFRICFAFNLNTFFLQKLLALRITTYLSGSHSWPVTDSEHHYRDAVYLHHRSCSGSCSHQGRHALGIHRAEEDAHTSLFLANSLFCWIFCTQTNIQSLQLHMSYIFNSYVFIYTLPQHINKSFHPPHPAPACLPPSFLRSVWLPQVVQTKEC